MTLFVPPAFFLHLPFFDTRSPPPSPLHFRLVLAQHTLPLFSAFLGPFRMEAWIISDTGFVLHLHLNAVTLLFARSLCIPFTLVFPYIQTLISLLNR